MTLLPNPEPPRRAAIGPVLATGFAIAVVAAVAYFATRRPARVAPPAAAPPTTTAAAPPAPASTTRLPPKPAAAVPARRPAVEAPAKPPPLRVESDVAGASVFVDRKFAGKAPIDIADVAPGPHRVNVSAEGYEMQVEEIEIGDAPVLVRARFKEVRLDEAIEVVHKHGMGSCRGRLSATPAGMRFDAAAGMDSWSAKLPDLDRFEMDYLKNTLRVSLRGGRDYNFTTDAKSADPLLAFQQKVDKAKRRLAGS